MFEKSLYDLIRGLRNHKGNEKEYIQNCLKECRAEIRSQDMDLKATALLKLIYLEMVGHDMSWASFYVLEVMSSPKYHQKRVGYLGAVQSFRPDTEVLMLATNLLKKDLTIGMPTTIALPIAALPHIITPSLALSVLPDLLPRMNHNLPAIRKKTIVTLYRLALVYPETLRAAWPKIKERLMDHDEDPSVTAAIVNVVCELGWRRPSDFLPLAPRFFELLVDGNNNWMAIKLVKLFATLTPLEPRLIRKLQVPLMDLIRTTPAMSLLYECINGVIQGGILGDADNTTGTEEIATLCVSKLRSMITVHNDSNLKYVALLAFNKIVLTHPELVAQQEDVIIDCIDSEDMTIRMKALDLVQGMVSIDNLVSIVSRLMRQLKASSSAAAGMQRNASPLQDPDANSDDEASVRRPRSAKADQPASPLPEDYTTDVIGRIIDMCSKGNYDFLVDFEWYIDVLIQLVRVSPVPRARDYESESSSSSGKYISDVSEKVGDEIRNVAVKVRDIRYAAVAAADSILQQMATELSTYYVSLGVIKPAAFVVGEFWQQLSSPEDTLGYLLQLMPRTNYPEALATCIQAAIKILAAIAGDEQAQWTPERKSRISLLMARVIHTLEPLTMHPYLEVQERAVQFSELLKLTAEAVSGQAAATDELHQDPPLLLTQAIPSLFSGWELNSVRPGQQERIRIPDDLDLDEPIHPNLNALLAAADSLGLPVAGEDDEFEVYYNQKPPPTSIANEPAINRLAGAHEEVSSSYQRAGEESYLDPDIVARRRAERRERNKDDPFYIPDSSSVSPGGHSTPIHNILRHENGPDLDIDSIPIMQLDLEKLQAGIDNNSTTAAKKPPVPRPKPRQRIVIAADETIPSGSVSAGPPTPRQYDSEGNNNNSDSFTRARSKKLKASLLQVDSSVIGNLSLDADNRHPEAGGFDYERQKREEAEMAQAVKEVERLRLEMQRANERIKVAQGVPDEGTVLKKKKKKKVKKSGVAAGEDDESGKMAKKKKKKVAVIDEGGGGEGPGLSEGGGDDEVVAAKPKKKKKKVVKLDGESEETAQA